MVGVAAMTSVTLVPTMADLMASTLRGRLGMLAVICCLYGTRMLVIAVLHGVAPCSRTDFKVPPSLDSLLILRVPHVERATLVIQKRGMPFDCPTIGRDSSSMPVQ